VELRLGDFAHGREDAQAVEEADAVVRFAQGADCVGIWQGGRDSERDEGGGEERLVWGTVCVRDNADGGGLYHEVSRGRRGSGWSTRDGILLDAVARHFRRGEDVNWALCCVVSCLKAGSEWIVLLLLLMLTRNY
jgi:hypothetical protein